MKVTLHLFAAAVLLFSSNSFAGTLLDHLSKTTTIFVYRTTDDVEALKAAFEGAWTFTPIEFVAGKDFNLASYDSELYTFIVMGATNVETSTESFTRTYLHFCTADYSIGTTKINVDFSPDVNFKIREFVRDKKSGYEKFIREVYENPDVEIMYWEPAYLRNELQRLEYSLHHPFKILDEEHNTALHGDLSVLATNKLYFPPHMFHEAYRAQSEQTAQTYNYPFEISPLSTVADLILNTDDPVYYVRYEAKQTFIIVDGRTGLILEEITSPTGTSISFYKKGFKRMNEEIEKAIKRNARKKK